MSLKENALKEFDFWKVAKVMNAIGWKYWDTVGDGVTVDELKKVASSCIDSLLAKESLVSIGTGGFYAEWERVGEGEDSKTLKLMFVLEEVYGFEDSEYK
jgi:hypothetical protein